MRMLFGEEIGCMAEDGFEGSKEEYHVFTDVFHGDKKFQPDKNNCPNALASVNRESSVLRSLWSNNYMLTDSFKNLEASAKEISARSTETTSNSGLEDQNLISLQTTVNDSVNTFPGSVSRLHVAKISPVSTYFGSHKKLPFRIVETFGQGILSSYLFSSRLGADEDDKSKEGESMFQHSGQGKAFMEVEPVTSDCNANCATDLLVPCSVIEEEKSQAPVSLNPMIEASNILEPKLTDDTKERATYDTKKMASSKDLTNRLRSHAFQVLKNAGWKIEKRKHKGRTSDNLYRSPGEGPLLHSLPRAWIACGEMLFAQLISKTDETARHWIDIDAFWDDLADILESIENKFQPRKTSLSLLHRWQVLDPFIAVACIDKRINALRMGRALKAVNSTTTFLDDDRNSNFTENYIHFNALTERSDTSRESYSPGLSASDRPAILNETYKALICMKQRIEEFGTLKLDTVDAARKRFFIQDLPTRLRLHAFDLLVDAGWKIEIRERKPGGYTDHIYKPPRGTFVYSLVRAWKSFGQMMCVYELFSRKDFSGRQWTDINGFWDDLTDTLDFLDREIQHQENALTYLLRWLLLDPFMAVVCIDKKVGALRGGRAVKAMNSSTIFLDEKNDSLLDANSIHGVKFHILEPSTCSMSHLSRCQVMTLGSNNKSKMNGSSGSHQQSAKRSCQNFKTKQSYSHVECKRNCGTDIRSRSLRRLARRIGKGLLDERDLHGAVSKASSRWTKATDQVFNLNNKNQKKLHLPNPAGVLKNDILSPETGTLESRTVTSHAPESSKGACPSNLVAYTSEEGGVCLGPNEKFPIRPHNRKSPDQPFLYPQKKRLCQGRDECSRFGLGGIAYENTPCKSLEVVTQLEKPEHSSVRSGSIKRALYFAEGLKVGEVSDPFAAPMNAGIQDAEQELNQVALNGLITYGDTGNFIEAQNAENIAAGHQILFLYPQEEISCSSMDGICGQDPFACVCVPNAIRGDCAPQESHDLNYETSLMNVFGINNSIFQNMNFPVQQLEHSLVPRQECDVSEKVLEMKDFENHREKICGGIVNPSSLLEESSKDKPFTSIAKKVPGKSSKVSEIKKGRKRSKIFEANPHKINYKAGLEKTEDNEENDHYGFLINQEGPGDLRWEATSDCSNEFSCFEKQRVSVSNGKVDNASVVLEPVSTMKPLKESVKSGKKVPKGHNKVHKGSAHLLLEDGSVGAQSKCYGYQQEILQAKSAKITCNAMDKCGKTSTSVSLRHHKNASNKKGKHQTSCFTESVLASDDETTPLKSDCEDSFGNALVLGNGETTDHVQEVRQVKNSLVPKENGTNRLPGRRIYDNDLLISAIIKNKDFSVGCKPSASKAVNSHCKSLEKTRSQKTSCKLLLRSPVKGGERQIILGARSVLSWLIQVSAISVNDYIQYQNPNNKAVVKDGRVTRDGILCNCCQKILSLSDFKFHAGCKAHRSTLNLFLGSGKSYTLCQLRGWSIEYKARKNAIPEIEDELYLDDDTCSHCGDGGGLICCDKCPSTYHQACLPLQVNKRSTSTAQKANAAECIQILFLTELPEGNWYCPKCTCEICGDVVDSMETSSSWVALECSQCEHQYHDTCIKEKFIRNGEAGSDKWFCGENCLEVYFGLRSRVGIMNCMDDGFSWTILRCNHVEQRVRSAQKIGLMADCNTKLAVALSIMEECFLPMIDPRTGINMISHVMYNWGFKFTRLNYQGFYTAVLEKDDVIISVASIRVHGVTLAEMPLIATCTEYRRQGMCRRLMGAIEEMLKTFKVRMLVLSAVPQLVDTWIYGFGFKPLEDDQKRRLSTISLMCFPGTVMLKKRLYHVTD